MGYIYLITNKINNKQYIGKTEFSIEKRWREHCADSKRERYEKRPLYDAMNKYGIDNFTIECIEETDNLEEREQYWIDIFNTYINGYNATIGGDGKRRFDYDLIYQYWLEGKTQKEIASLVQCSPDTVAHVLRQKGITEEETYKRAASRKAIKVQAIDPQTSNILCTYNSYREAAIDMLNKHLTNCKPGTGAAHISEVCRGKRKSFAKLFWQHIN